MDYNNRFFRVHSIVVDAYGIDPLKDKMAERLGSITKWTPHVVTQAERGALDLISEIEYGTEDYWWHIQAYNGVCSWREVIEGLTLKIPDYGAIIALTTEMTQMSNPVSTIAI